MTNKNTDICRTIFEKMSDPILLLKDGCFIDCNAATLKLLGYPSKTEFLNRRPAEISPPFQPDGRSSDEKAAEMIAIAMREGFHRFEWSHSRADGTIVPVEVMLTPIILNGEMVLHTLWRDITDRIRAYEELRRSETKLRTLYDSTSDAVMLLNARGFLDCNKATLKIFGCATHEAFCSMHPADLSPPKQPCGTDSMELANQHIATAMDVGKHHFEWVHKRADTGISFPAEVLLSAMTLDDVPVLQAVVRDITKRKNDEEEIRNLAFYDTLTRLPNRRLLNERLKHIVTATKRTGRYAALMFLDLDNFKPLNDMHGHAVGDLLLIEVAMRLKNCVREMDVVARFGGDEFIVALNDLGPDETESITQARFVAEKIRSDLSKPYVLSVHSYDHAGATIEHHCSTSIGVNVFSSHESGTNDILKRADVAMYQAKEAGRNRVRFYEPAS